MFYQGEIEKKERRKVVVIATAIVAIVLILVVSIIVVAAKKSDGGNVGGKNNTIFVADQTDEETPKAEETQEEAKAEDTKVQAPVNPSTTVQETASVVPTTGPEDLLPTALALGSLTTASVAYVMSKKQLF